MAKTDTHLALLSGSLNMLYFVIIHPHSNKKGKKAPTNVLFSDLKPIHFCTSALLERKLKLALF